MHFFRYLNFRNWSGNVLLNFQMFTSTCALKLFMSNSQPGTLYKNQLLFKIKHLWGTRRLKTSKYKATKRQAKPMLNKHEFSSPEFKRLPASASCKSQTEKTGGIGRNPFWNQRSNAPKIRSKIQKNRGKQSDPSVFKLQIAGNKPSG